MTPPDASRPLPRCALCEYVAVALLLSADAEAADYLRRILLAHTRDAHPALAGRPS